MLMKFCPQRGSTAILLAVVISFALSGCTGKKVRHALPQEEIYQWQGGAEIPFEQQMAQFYNNWKGVPWRLGENGRHGMDCSAFIQKAVRCLLGVNLPRTVVEMVRYGKKLRREELQPGDLVFFRTGWNVRHVGMYLGNSRFMHVSSSKGVSISALQPVDGYSGYWNSKYWCARRIL
ncbi:C40 family peptidase [Desulforhopalus vacuolatus]|uniref:NlpC/P60 family protein n=1 Tax=Desulforhopalus vacuolatus TaxID=40414 RepID=UPI001962B7CB|nr:NlpC/P60 family protein [Desulforhopalus vacuolatus]MBM9519713.1 C40 family peptidase [Desulforhopalus vacuolatus]